mmetsp:Transcript_32126/g.73501  ORF Transcript_32126/g.73501 Transcript_32126/m.73501 type:complete len:252 (+) Transcript_32126:2325-3080(+)
MGPCRTLMVFCGLGRCWHTRLLLPHHKGNAKHLSGLQPLKTRAICPGSLNLVPRRHRKSNHLREDASFVALGCNSCVCCEPHRQQEKHEGSTNRHLVAKHKPVWGSFGELPLDPQSYNKAQDQHAHKQVCRHLPLHQTHNVTNIFSPKGCLRYAELHLCNFLLSPHGAIIEKVLTVVAENSSGTTTCSNTSSSSIRAMAEYTSSCCCRSSSSGIHRGRVSCLSVQSRYRNGQEGSWKGASPSCLPSHPEHI